MLPRLLIITLFGLCLSCSSARPQGPQPTGINSRAFVGDAEIEVKYRFEPQVGKEIVLYVDTVGHRGTAGPVRLYVRLDGFMVLRGKEEWEVEVGPGRTESHQLMLRAVERAPRLTVVTHHVERAVELASDELRFWVDEDGFVVECQPEDEACK